MHKQNPREIILKKAREKNEAQNLKLIHPWLHHSIWFPMSLHHQGLRIIFITTIRIKSTLKVNFYLKFWPGSASRNCKRLKKKSEDHSSNVKSTNSFSNSYTWWPFPIADKTEFLASEELIIWRQSFLCPVRQCSAWKITIKGHLSKIFSCQRPRNRR